jgi:hypothetical protein
VLLSTANAQTRSSTPIRYAARIDAYGRGLRLGVPVDEFEVPVAIFEEPDSRSREDTGIGSCCTATIAADTHNGTYGRHTAQLFVSERINVA